MHREGYITGAIINSIIIIYLGNVQAEENRLPPDSGFADNMGHPGVTNEVRCD
jgi:hypothetical protein